MILIICAYVYYFLIVLSIGAGTLKLMSRITGADLNNSYNIFYKFWFGLGIVVGVLQLLSLFLRVQTVTFVIISALALVYPVLYFNNLVLRIKSLSGALYSAKGIVSAVVVLLLLIIVSYSANREVLI